MYRCFKSHVHPGLFSGWVDLATSVINEGVIDLWLSPAAYKITSLWCCETWPVGAHKGPYGLEPSMNSVFQRIIAAQFNIQPLVKRGPRPHLRSFVCCSQRLGLDWGVNLGREFRGSLGSWGGGHPFVQFFRSPNVWRCILYSLELLFPPILQACSFYLSIILFLTRSFM